MNWLDKYNDVPEAQNGIEGTMGGLTDVGFDYNGAWNGTMKMGGSIPGTVGFTYARTQSPAPSNGKYAKKTKASAQNGEKIKAIDLPPVWVIGSKSKDNYTENFYKDFYDTLIRTKAIESGVTTDELTDYINSDPEYSNQIMGEYQGLMNLGEKYGFPRVGKFSREGIYKNHGGKYDPINEIIYANDSNTWKSELAHHIQLKDNKLKKALQFIGNDLTSYILGESPYKTLGTVEHEAHSIIEPGLDNEVENVKQKYTLSKKRNGAEMKFYQEGLDWKPKTISQNGSVIEDPMGQWAHPGEITRIPSNEITMQGVDYPVLGISNTGDTQMMQPGQDYSFDGSSVTEIPMMQNGGWLDKYK